MSGHAQSATSRSHMWCPFCGAVIGDDPSGGERIACDHCRRTASRELVLNASAWRSYEAQVTEYAASLHRQVAAMQYQAVHYDNEAVRARGMARAALAAARGSNAARPPLPSVHPAESVVPAAQHRAVPVSVLLQGTGALLLLAALMIGSAVLWGVLAPVVQALLLIALVAAVGAATAWLMRRLPATGNVLAVLTAAAGVVVGSALPRIIGGFGSLWYPTAAAAAGAAASLVAGRALGVRLWWHTGLLTAAVSAALAIGTVVLWSELEPWGLAWSVCLLLLTLPVALASLLVSRAETARDPETAWTTAWIGAAGMGVVLAALLAAGRVWLVQLADASLLLADRLVLVAAVLVVALALWWLARRAFAPDLLDLTASGLLGVAAMVLVIPVPPFSGPARVVAAVVPVVVLGALAGRPGPRSAAAAAGVGGAALLGMTAVGELDASWQILLAWGLGSAVIAAVSGLARTSSGWLVLAAGVMGATWSATWFAGHLGTATESLVLPVAAFLLGLWSAGRWRGVVGGAWADARVGQLLVLASVTPSVVTSWRDQMSGQWVLWRVLLVVGALAVVALWSALARSGWTVPVVAAVVVALGHTWVGVSGWPEAPAEAYSVSLAIAVLLIAAAGARDGWARGRPVAGWSLLVAVAPSVVLLIMEPEWDAAVALRLLWTTSVAAVLIAVTWRRPVAAWLVGTVGMVLPLWVYQAWLGGQSAVPEALTAPIAVVVAVSAGLGARAASGWSPVQAGLRAGMWALLVPSSVLAVAVVSPTTPAEQLRLISVLAGLGLVAVLADRWAPIDSLISAVLVVVVGWLPVARAAMDNAWILEGFTVPLAVAATLVAGWLLRPATAAAWWRVARWPSLAVLIVSSLWSVTMGVLPSDDWQNWARVGVVVVAWIMADYFASSWAAAAFGCAGVLVAAVNTISLLYGRAEQAIELVTWPAAAALGIMAWRLWRAAGQRGPSLLWVGPPVGLALLPTAATAFVDGSAGWRAWFGLLIGAAVLVVGVRVEWAGLVLPGLLAVIIVAAPVLLQAAVDAPLWIPLTIAGGLLIAIGARLEATRREGHRLIDWAVRLH